MAVERKSTAITLWLILLLTGILCVLPFLWIVSASFKPNTSIEKGQVWPWDTYKVKKDEEPGEASEDVTDETASTTDVSGQTPEEQEDDNAPRARYTAVHYKNLYKNLRKLPTYYFNTIYLAMAGTFLSVFIGSLAAYGFARFKFIGSNLLFTLVLMTIMIPLEVTLIGRFELMFQFHLFDKIVGLLIVYVAGCLLLVIFIMRNVFMSVPQDLLDAAMVDGAGTWQVFWEIMIPIGRNGLAACGVLTFLAIWNEFVFALTFTSLDKARTLPIGIMMLRKQMGGQENIGILFATVLLSFLPIVIVFILLQRYFVRGLAAGALKQ